MKSSVKWKEGMMFEGSAGPHVIPLDAQPPLGKNSGPTPKELLTIALAGCTSMDVVALMKKFKEPLSTFEVDVDATPVTQGHPSVFEKVEIVYRVTGEVSSEKLLEAIHLSQSKYCSVSAMLSKAFPISYRVVLNGMEIGTGASKF